jgi:hypothetical protein
MNLRLKAILGLAAIFAAGTATGVIVSPRFHSHAAPKPFPAAEWIDTTVAEYRTHLSLDAETEHKVHAAITAAAQNIVKERSETQQRLQAIIKAMNGEILPQLDASRQETLKQWIEERRTRMGQRPM